MREAQFLILNFLFEHNEKAAFIDIPSMITSRFITKKGGTGSGGPLIPYFKNTTILEKTRTTIVNK